MLCREIIYACSEILTKQINTLCGQNVGFLNGGGDDGVLRAVLCDDSSATQTQSSVPVNVFCLGPSKWCVTLRT